MEKRLSKEIRELYYIIGNEVKKFSDPHKYINPTQFQIMLYLLAHMNEEICQKDIEIETHLKKASITGTLDSLEEKGAIIRKQDENDKRKNIIMLSKNAIKYKDKLLNRINSVNEKAVAGISQEELQQLFKTLDKIKDNLKEA